MAVSSSPNSAAHKWSVKLLRAVEKRPVLYDRTAENYRKKMPSDNAWDLVASESGEPVEVCKRRYRQIRNDYSRFIASDIQRQRTHPKRAHESKPYYLGNELKFLEPHMHTEKDSLDHEPERKSKSAERTPTHKSKKKDTVESVEKQPLAKPQESETNNNNNNNKSKARTEEKLKLKEEKTQPEAEDSRSGSEDSEEPEEPPSKKKSLHREEEESASIDEQPFGDSPQPEFFIKHSASSNCLIIGKKRAASTATEDPDPLGGDNMSDDSADETQSIGGGRRPRRAAAAAAKRNASLAGSIKKLPTDTRLQRLQRRQSLTMAVASSLRSSTSPVKMAPLPRNSLPQTKPPSSSPAPVAKSNSRDDIFPRPRSATQAPPQQRVQVPTAMRGPGRPPRVSSLALPPAVMNELIRSSMTPKTSTTSTISSAAEVFKLPASPSSVVSPPSPTAAPAAAAAVSTAATSVASRLVSASNTLVISTTSCPISQPASSSSLALSIMPSTTSTASITASPILSSGAPFLGNARLIRRIERSCQTDGPDIFSDEHFLNTILPQMREMNGRQKLLFKQKIFKALMETFDDATEFPEKGEVQQHFNINTPSGYENVTDAEMRLMRELASIICAAKHTAQLSAPAEKSSASANSTPPMSHSPLIVKAKTPTIQRMQRPAASPIEEKRLYRIMHVAGGNKVLATAVRQDSVDSNSSQVSNRAKPFAVPGLKPARSTDSLATPAKSGVIAKAATPPVTLPIPNMTEPALLRQMSRRYSICGSGGGTSTTLAAPMPGKLLTQDNSLLKRRITPVTQLNVPMQQQQQRSRYNSPMLNPAGLTPNNSLLVRRPPGKQTSPLAAMQRTPQIATIHGGAVFGDFPTPSTVRANVAAAAAALSPQKRLIVANAKSNAQQKPSPPLGARPPVVLMPNPNAQAKSSSSNVASLLSTKDSRSRSQSPKQRSRLESQTAGVIEADNYEMPRLKREPLDEDELDMLQPDHTDILGI